MLESSVWRRMPLLRRVTDSLEVLAGFRLVENRLINDTKGNGSLLVIGLHVLDTAYHLECGFYPHLTVAAVHIWNLKRLLPGF